MKTRLTWIFLLLTTVVLYAQNPFSREVAAFVKQDSVRFPPKKAILFAGSSSFRLWKDVTSDFPGKRQIVNRGFGGSSLPDVIAFADQIMFPYKPRQIVIYCGENDIAGGATSGEVVERFKKLFSMIRSNLPKRTRVVYVSIKPSPSRNHLRNEMIAANTGIRDFLAGQKRAVYVDVFSLMLDANGEPRKELFIQDMLHMNRAGYDIWRDALQPYLIK